jgi:hypothetical protein
MCFMNLASFLPWILIYCSCTSWPGGHLTCRWTRHLSKWAAHVQPEQLMYSCYSQGRKRAKSHVSKETKVPVLRKGSQETILDTAFLRCSKAMFITGVVTMRQKCWCPLLPLYYCYNAGVIMKRENRETILGTREFLQRRPFTDGKQCVCCCLS